MVNLLDLCAVAVPAGSRPEGLPFGVQLIAPAFADRPLLDLAARWSGEPAVQHSTELAPGRVLLAVAGAHLTGQPLNGDLIELGGRLHARARTAAGYRMYRVPGPVPRPGLVRGGGPDTGIELELWELPSEGLGRLLSMIAEPLALGQVHLDDGTVVTGFVADASAIDVSTEIVGHGGWRAYLAAG